MPILRGGMLKGYRVKMWGEYRALTGVQGQGEVLEGWVYMVKSKEELEKLAMWEGENYEVDVCDSLVGGDERLLGNIFVFCGGMPNLRDVDTLSAWRGNRCLLPALVLCNAGCNFWKGLSCLREPGDKHFLRETLLFFLLFFFSSRKK